MRAARHWKDLLLRRAMTDPQCVEYMDNVTTVLLSGWQVVLLFILNIGIGVAIGRRWPMKGETRG